MEYKIKDTLYELENAFTEINHIGFVVGTEHILEKGCLVREEYNILMFVYQNDRVLHEKLDLPNFSNYGDAEKYIRGLSVMVYK